MHSGEVGGDDKQKLLSGPVTETRLRWLSEPSGSGGHVGNYEWCASGKVVAMGLVALWPILLTWTNFNPSMDK